MIYKKIPVMHPSLGSTAPLGLRVAGYNFTALPFTFLPKTRRSKFTLTCRELIDAFRIDMNVKQSRRASHMYIHVPRSDDLARNTLPVHTFVTSPFKAVHFQMHCKNYYDEVNGCIFTKLTLMKSK